MNCVSELSMSVACYPDIVGFQRLAHRRLRDIRRAPAISDGSIFMDHDERRAALSRCGRESSAAMAASRASCLDSQEHVRQSKRLISRSLELLQKTFGASLRDRQG
jgi:hypothetical protein